MLAIAEIAAVEKTVGVDRNEQNGIVAIAVVTIVKMLV